jgi:predicted dehydrogenase
MKRISRRGFLKVSAAGAAGAGVFSGVTLADWRVWGANDDIRIGIMGFNGKGKSHIKAFEQSGKGSRVVALCDVDTAIIKRGQDMLKKKDIKVETFVDIRKMLEMKDLDGIAIATPNHWHTLGTVWGCQAGKDVYVEKPCSHNIFEGRKCIEAAAKYKRIVQHGTQSRSAGGLREAFKVMQSGKWGKILWTRGLCYKPRGSIGKTEGPQKVPETVNYDLWLGPAPKKPLRRKRFHYDWHWFWDYGNADIGNQGVHEMDMARWALGQDTLPEMVISLGGRFVVDDDAEVPNTQIAYYDYKPYPMLFEVRGLGMKKGIRGMDHYREAQIGVVVQCEGGYFAGGGGGGRFYDKDHKEVQRFGGGGGAHQSNFLKAMRSRKPEDEKAPMHEAHLSTALIHMANTSYRVSKEKSFDETKETIKGIPEMVDSYERMLKHLEANGVNLKESKVTSGTILKFDPKTEKFVGECSEGANKLITREYRKPFVVPDQV